jgi:hypothetical protein
MKPFLDELSDFAVSLSKREHILYSSPLQWVGLANGDADFHDNVIFFGFDEGQDEPVLVVKAPRLVENGWMLKTEYHHLMELWNCIGPEAVNYVPKPYALTSIQEQPVLLISYISGESLTRLSRRSFWGDNQKVTILARDAARTLRDLTRLTERPIQGEEVLNLDLPSKAGAFRELFQLNAEEDNALAELTQIVDKTSKAASHNVLIQGDFWHGNMIRDKTNGRLMFVDWQFARWSADVSMDVYFFLLAGALSATGDGPLEERARLAFRLLCDWRADVIPEYLTAYGQPDHHILLPQKYGMLLCCVEKATRSALEFGYSHPDDLMWRYLFAELLQWPAEN